MTQIPELNNSTPVTDGTLFVGRDPEPQPGLPDGQDRRYSGAQMRAFATAARVTVVPGAALSITAEHIGAVLWFTSATPVTVTVPVPVPGLNCALIQGGDGRVIVDHEAGAPVFAEGDLYGTAARFSPLSLLYVEGVGYWLGGQRA